MSQITQIGWARAAVVSLCTVSTIIAGCPAPAPPAPVTVELVNETGFDVRPNYYVSAEAGTPADLFVEANRRTDFTDRAFPELRPNETITLSLDCDQAKSIGSQFPVLFDSTTLTVMRSEDELFALRDESFACGDTVRLVFFREGDAFHVRLE